MIDMSEMKLPDGWRWIKLGEVCEIVGGSTPETYVSEYWDGDIVWITPSDLGQMANKDIMSSSRKISTAGLENSGAKMLPAGAVVMSSRAPIGYLGISQIPLCTNQGCKSFITSQCIDAQYLYWTLNRMMDDIRALGSGATFTEVSKVCLSKFKIPLPPLEDQKRIARILDEQMAAVKKARAVIEDQLRDIDRLPVALLQRAYSGGL